MSKCSDKELIKRLYSNPLSLLLKAQCDLNLSKANSIASFKINLSTILSLFDFERSVLWRVRRNERERIEDYEDSDERSSTAINQHITKPSLGDLVKPVLVYCLLQMPQYQAYQLVCTSQ